MLHESPGAENTGSARVQSCDSVALRTSASGHLQTSPAEEGMSASPLKADIRPGRGHDG
jgi:hypothetical protein